MIIINTPPETQVEKCAPDFYSFRTVFMDPMPEHEIAWKEGIVAWPRNDLSMKRKLFNTIFKCLLEGVGEIVGNGNTARNMYMTTRNVPIVLMSRPFPARTAAKTKDGLKRIWPRRFGSLPNMFKISACTCEYIGCSTSRASHARLNASLRLPAFP